MPRSLFWCLKRFRQCTSQYRKRTPVCLSPPVRLWIEPTNVCNLRCIMCPTGRGNVGKPGYMSLDLFRKIADEAADFAVDINFFGRGEPFIHPELVQMVDYAHRRGLNTRLESNATVLTPEKSEAVIKNGLDFISFSFDGYTKETYESIRRGANFEKTLNNIISFLEIKKRLGSAKPYVSIQFIQTVSFQKGAARPLEREFKRRFRNLPVNTYRYVVPHRYVGEIEEEVTGTMYGYMTKGTDNRLFLKLRYTPCPYPWFSAHILFDGTVTPCCMDFHSRYLLGNINGSTLLEIWNAPPIRKLRGAVGSGAFKEIPPCAQCDLLYQTSLFGISTKNVRDFKIFIKENLL